MLNQQDYAFLNTKLKAPVVISGILDGQTALTDEVHYGLHEMISDFEPDTALLAIAAGAKTILGRYKSAGPGAQVLTLECDRILEEYGTLWLENARGGSPGPDEIFDVLSGTAEDLESLAALLETHLSGLQDNEKAGTLCEILHVQARAHSMIAEEFMKAADTAAQELDRASKRPESLPAQGNVIRFPLEYGAH